MSCFDVKSFWEVTNEVVGFGFFMLLIVKKIFYLLVCGMMNDNWYVLLLKLEVLVLIEFVGSRRRVVSLLSFSR